MKILFIMRRRCEIQCGHGRICLWGATAQVLEDLVFVVCIIVVMCVTHCCIWAYSATGCKLGDGVTWENLWCMSKWHCVGENDRCAVVKMSEITLASQRRQIKRRFEIYANACSLPPRCLHWRKSNKASTCNNNALSSNTT